MEEEVLQSVICWLKLYVFLFLDFFKVVSPWYCNVYCIETFAIHLQNIFISVTYVIYFVEVIFFTIIKLFGLKNTLLTCSD